MDEKDVKKRLESPGIEGKDFRIKRLLPILSIFALAVLACNLPYMAAPVPTPTQPDLIRTAVALTLTAQLTQAAPPTQTLAPTATHSRTPVPSLTPTLSATPTFAVTGVTADVTPLTYTGPCPVEITWSATITVNGPGTLTYQWEVEGGAPGPVQDLTFSGAGSQTVTMQRPFSTGTPDATQWRRVRILTPNEVASNQPTITLTCQPDIDVTPDTADFGEITCHLPGYYAITIENVSSGRLEISSVRITSGSTFFSIADDTCTGTHLTFEQQCTMAIQFGPLGVCGSSGSTYGGNLRIKSNDPDEGTVNVILSAPQK